MLFRLPTLFFAIGKTVYAVAACYSLPTLGRRCAVTASSAHCLTYLTPSFATLAGRVLSNKHFAFGLFATYFSLYFLPATTNHWRRSLRLSTLFAAISLGTQARWPRACTTFRTWSVTTCCKFQFLPVDTANASSPLPRAYVAFILSPCQWRITMPTLWLEENNTVQRWYYYYDGRPFSLRYFHVIACIFPIWLTSMHFAYSFISDSLSTPPIAFGRIHAETPYGSITPICSATALVTFDLCMPLWPSAVVAAVCSWCLVLPAIYAWAGLLISGERSCCRGVSRW